MTMRPTHYTLCILCKDEDGLLDVEHIIQGEAKVWDLFFPFFLVCGQLLGAPTAAGCAMSLSYFSKSSPAF